MYLLKVPIDNSVRLFNLLFFSMKVYAEAVDTQVSQNWTGALDGLNCCKNVAFVRFLGALAKMECLQALKHISGN